MKPISRLGIGPLSSEIIESVFKYSHNTAIPLMLISSMNQVDWDGGYVNNWRTRDYIKFINSLKKKYSLSKVFICRDHCGPGFKNIQDSLKDVYKTINDDIDNGFDLIHIDFCHLNESYDFQLKKTIEAIDYIYRRKSNILIEVGTEENNGLIKKKLSEIKSELDLLVKNTAIHFVVFQTGSLVKEDYQAGQFELEHMRKIREICLDKKVYIKEHNADYLNVVDINLRKELIDAFNIAPQFGVLQTQITLQKCLLYGIKTNDFLNDAYSSGKWKKWLYKNKSSNIALCSLIAGHYVFSHDSYKSIVDQINRFENFSESVVTEVMKIIEMYMKNN